MIAHATPEALSSLIDGELPGAERQRVSDHVEGCPSCRARLASMRRVVATLRGLERTAPPPTLALHVERRVALEGRSVSPVERFEERLRRLPLQPSLATFFALVLALAAILYLFAHGVDRAGRRGVPIVVPPPEAARAWQPGSGEGALAEAGGRQFALVRGAWVEAGLSPGAEARRIATGSPEGLALLADEPWLGALLSEAPRVVLRLPAADGEAGGEVVALEAAAGPPAPTDAP